MIMNTYNNASFDLAFIDPFKTGHSFSALIAFILYGL